MKKHTLEEENINIIYMHHPLYIYMCPGAIRAEPIRARPIKGPGMLIMARPIRAWPIRAQEGTLGPGP